ncbi:MAG TPA: AraC family transcriptional regulator [Verrucomicrobiae bacterium]
MKSDLLAGSQTSQEGAAVFSGRVALVEQLFDHLPETAFFLKDVLGRYVSVNQSLVERCGLQDKRQLLGRHVRQVFPKELARVYSAQDEAVLRTGRAIIEHLELHWYARRRPGWCLTTKVPVRDDSGKIIGVVGISRDLRAPGDREIIPASLAGTLEYLETHFEAQLSPHLLAERAGLPAVRFARLIKRIFRLTPNQMIMQTRVSAAAQLLADTDRSISEIAVTCGFYDHSALTKAFRSATSLTPTQFRRLRREHSP